MNSALEQLGVIGELGETPIKLAASRLARYAFLDRGALHVALGRVYQVGVSLPDALFAVFEAETRDLPRETEVERLVLQRKGQDIF